MTQRFGGRQFAVTRLIESYQLPLVVADDNARNRPVGQQAGGNLSGKAHVVSVGSDARRALDGPDQGIEAQIETLRLPLPGDRQDGPYRKDADHHAGGDDQQRGAQHEAAIEPLLKRMQEFIGQV